jgi:hypothetical protein
MNQEDRTAEGWRVQPLGHQTQWPREDALTLSRHTVAGPPDLV